MTTLDIDQHLTALTAGVALTLRGVGGDGEGHNRVVGMVGLSIEEERTLGTQTRRKDLTLGVATRQDATTTKTRCRSDMEIRIGRIGVVGGFHGLLNQLTIRLGHLAKRSVRLVLKDKLLFHNLRLSR